MTYRIKKRKKVYTKNIGKGYLLKMRLLPWIHTSKGCVWLAALAVSKSKRQINDWLEDQKQRTRVRRLASSLTGKIGNGVQAIAIRQVRQWMSELPKGHSIALQCESVLPEKQFRVWKKWFERHEDMCWEINEEYKSFFFYKRGC
jgi:hypothetical protein